jgi:hypothetical protein
MSQSPTKRNPLLNAPNSQDIMTGARRRQASQNTSIPVSQHSGIPESNNTGIPAQQRGGKQVHQNTGKPESQRTGVPVSQLDSETPKRKATYYLPADLQKALKKYAFLKETNQSQVVEDAVKEYMSKRPSAAMA